MGFVEPLVTDRLVLRPWLVEDAAEALGIYGHPDVARWLSPEMDQVPDLAAMRLLLQQWVAEDDRMPPPAGRWAIDRRDDGRLLGGGILLPLPPGREDLEVGWQLHPQVWGHGYASETTRALAGWASVMTSTRSSRWSGRGTRVPRRPSAAMGWNGSGRPASISGWPCRCSDSAAPTSTPEPRPPRCRRTHHRVTDPSPRS
jgi:hypothetical protein